MSRFSNIFVNSSKSSRQAKRRPASRSLRMESLEQRAMFSVSTVVTSIPIHLPVFNTPSQTFTVNSAADSGGIGTLRWAIDQVNLHGAGYNNIINFDITRPGPLKSPVPSYQPTIDLSSALPDINYEVTINGTTQFGGRVEINGGSVVPPAPARYTLAGVFVNPTEPYQTTPSGEQAVDGLVLLGGNSIVEGLDIDQFTGDGLVLAVKGGDTVQNDYLGTDISGTTAPTINYATGAIGTVPANGQLPAGTFMIQEDGLLIDNVAGNTIGGTTAAARNVISGNAYYGIQITGSAATGNYVEGDYIGTNFKGTAGIGNLVAGVSLDGTTSNDTIGGTTVAARNVISWNAMGVSVSGTSNFVEGNFVGTDATGLNPLGNAGDGIGGGGPNTIADNVVSANGGNGISVSGGVTVVGNWVGVDASGDTVLKNDESGVYVIGEYNTIGGTTAAARNVISGNQNANVLIDAGASYNQVLGNYIGTNASDWMVLSNDIDIMIQGSASYNTIGGTTAAAANVIANAGVGVEITGGPDSDGEPVHNTVEGNYIGTNAAGTNAAGTTNFANGKGVEIATASTSAAPDYNMIGGTAAGTGNTIKFNGTAVDILAGAGERILGNSIYSNGTEIVLESALANEGQVAPVLNSVNRNNNSVQVSGKLQHTTPNTKFEIQIFSSPSLDANGNPEGETLLGTITVTTDGNGNANFNQTFNVSIPKMQFITATATSLDAKGNPENTSEFSKALVSN